MQTCAVCKTKSDDVKHWIKQKGSTGKVYNGANIKVCLPCKNDSGQ